MPFLISTIAYLPAPLIFFLRRKNDVKAAVQYIYDHAADYFISNKYVLLEKAPAHTWACCRVTNTVHL